MTESFAVRGRRKQFSGALFSVYTDQVEMPDGRPAARDYLRHLGAVGVVALDEAGKVVLLRQYRHALGRVIWELPAGLLDVGGEPPAEAAARELAEEADLAATQWHLLADMYPSPGCSDEVIRLFLARDLSPVPDQDRHERTGEEAGLVVERVDLDEAVAMALRGEIVNGAALVGLLAAAESRDAGWGLLRPADTPLDRFGPPPAPESVTV